MKRLIICLLFISFSIAHSEGNPESNYSKICPVVYELAKTIMTSRQMGMPISEAIKPISSTDDDLVNKLNRELVANAYRFDVQKTESKKSEIIERFANDTAIQCLEAK